jgi:16S rRNA (adenine1518-N6/adenine1519-N6)-dimethyltransferase
MIILMQKEVWERIIWTTKNKKTKSSVLSLFVQKKCTVSPKVDVLKNSFVPAPKVDSIVLHFKIIDDNSWIDDNDFLAFIKASFSNPRKKLISNLVNAWYEKEILLKKLESIWFGENVRPEELNLNDYINIIT